MPLKSKPKTRKAKSPKRERTRSSDSLERLVRNAGAELCCDTGYCDMCGDKAPIYTAHDEDTGEWMGLCVVCKAECLGISNGADERPAPATEANTVAAPKGNAAGDGSLDPLDGPTQAEILITLRASDAMARIIDSMVERNLLGSRSELADARLNYGEPFKYKWSRPIIVFSDGGEKAQPKE